MRLSEKVAKGLKIIVIVETAVLVGLMLTRTCVSYRTIHSTTSPNPEEFGPLYAALEYESPDATFLKLVTNNPGWIPFRRIGMTNTILSACAEAKRTNYVRILIANGANVERAIEDERKMANVEAEQLLRQVQAKETR